MQRRVKMFQKKYVRGKNFMKMPMPKSISWSSQSIFGCRDVVKMGLCHKIWNGWSTWILDDPWVLEKPNFTPKVKSGVVLSEHLVANLIDQDTRQWDRGKLAKLFILELVNRILGIYLSYQVSQDQVFWSLSSSGEFSVKSAYNSLRSTSQSPNT